LEKSKFWSLIGKLGVILTIVWIIIQMINHFNNKEEIEMKITGNHFKYILANEHQELMKEHKKILSLDKSYTNNINKNGTSIKNLLLFEKSKKAKNNWKFKSDLSSYLSYGSFLTIPEYNEIWTFKIENTGIKPIEDLVIELPFKGYYQLNSQKGKIEKSNFENRIAIGNLAPGYSVNITTWVNSMSFSYPEYTEEKTRVTHKYGWKKIDYPVKIKGILAWNERNNNTLFEIAIPLSILIIFITFMIGVSMAPKFEELEKKRKLKALQEMEELKKLEKEKTEIIKD
jgi:hypothetical protein